MTTDPQETLPVTAAHWLVAKKNRPFAILIGAAVVSLAIVGAAFVASDEERSIRRHQRSFVAENCPESPATANPAADFHACEQSVAERKSAIDKKQAGYARNTEAIKEANERAARSTAPTANQTDAVKAVQHAKGFLTYVAAHRYAPAAPAKHDPVDCDQSGLCTTSFDIGGEEDSTFCELSYYKGTAAARFTAHFPVPLTCEALGAVTRKAWPSTSSAPSGSTCRFSAGGLAGLRMLIENNSDNYGATTGVHVYPPEYEQRNDDFAEGVRTDESHAR